MIPRSQGERDSLLRTAVGLVAATLACCAGAAREARPSTPPPAQSVVFKSSMDGTALHGTLSLPAVRSGFPVLMIGGSGKVDADETIPGELTFTGRPEKLFRQLSDALVLAGHPTLRYDKRGVQGDTHQVDREIWKTADREHLIADAVDAARTLMQSTGVGPQGLVILGHSEGTVIAVETAIALGGTVRGLLLLGVQARSMKEMVHYQVVESRARHGSGIGEQGAPEEEYQKVLQMLSDSHELFAPDDKPMAWYRQYLAAPANEERIRQVHAPIAIFQGEQDPQTPIDEVDRLVRARDGRDLVVHRYPSLGHGFSPDKDGHPTVGPIAPQVLLDVVDAAQR